MINLNETINTIKKIGANNTRIVPMENQNPLDGNVRIEVRLDGNWSPVVSGIKKSTAEDIIKQATNRVILG